MGDSVPAGLVTTAILFLAVPSSFPNQGQIEQDCGQPHKRSFMLNLRTTDFLGSFLMLAAMALLITGLEEAASHLSWTGATVLGPLCASIILWLAFFANSRWVSAREGKSYVEPVFPWEFCRSRVMVGLLL